MVVCSLHLEPIRDFLVTSGVLSLYFIDLIVPMTRFLVPLESKELFGFLSPKRKKKKKESKELDTDVLCGASLYSRQYLG